MRTSEEIRAEIAGVQIELRLIHARRRAADIIIDQAKRLAEIELCQHRGGEKLDDPNDHATALVAWTRSDAGAELANAMAVRDFLEELPTLAEARKVLDPLHQELAEAIEAERQAEAEHRAAEKAVADAEGAAREKALAKIDQDPKVKKAREALAGIKRLGEPLSV